MNCSMGHEHRVKIDVLICDEATKAQNTVSILHARHDRYKSALEAFALGAHFHEGFGLRSFDPKECPGCVSQSLLDADRREDEKRQSDHK